MKFLPLVCLAVITIAGVVSDQSGVEEENGVLILTDENFERVLDANDHVFVMFYATWCGWSRMLAPKFEGAAQRLAGMNSTIKLGKVDGDKEGRITGDNSVAWYPTMKLFVHRNESYSFAQQYSGERTVDALVGWLLNQTGTTDPTNATTPIPETETISSA